MKSAMDKLTETEIALRQAEVSFAERFDATGNEVIGFRASARIMDLDVAVDVPRIKTEDDLRGAMANLARLIWATANGKETP